MKKTTKYKKILLTITSLILLQACGEKMEYCGKGSGEETTNPAYGYDWGDETVDGVTKPIAFRRVRKDYYWQSGLDCKKSITVEKVVYNANEVIKSPCEGTRDEHEYNGKCYIPGNQRFPWLPDSYSEISATKCSCTYGPNPDGGGVVCVPDKEEGGEEVRPECGRDRMDIPNRD